MHCAVEIGVDDSCRAFEIFPVVQGCERAGGACVGDEQIDGMGVVELMQPGLHGLGVAYVDQGGFDLCAFCTACLRCRIETLRIATNQAQYCVRRCVGLRERAAEPRARAGDDDVANDRPPYHLPDSSRSITPDTAISIPETV